MQLKFRLVSALSLALLIQLTSCKKDETPSNNKPDSELSVQSDDQNEISSSMDDVTNDANSAIEGISAFSGRLQNPPPSICGATITLDTLSNPRKITVSYNGVNCSNTHLRTGTVVISIPANVHWKDAGATLTVSYQNFKVKRLSDNKSVTINGEYTFTNVSGGLLVNLASLQTITHTLTSGTLTITFDDNSQRTWHVARKRVYTYDNGIVISISGNHTDGNNTQIAEWGLNRYGHAFTTSITSPLVIKQSCDFRLTAGEIKHEGVFTATAKFGLDVNGNPTGCPGSGHYFYRLTWALPNGGSGMIIMPY